jgi:hypothetical protein
MFSDIKQVLKAVEESKSKLDTQLNEINRQREKTKLFYNKNVNIDIIDSLVPSRTSSQQQQQQDDDENEIRRTRKLVDGCISAITTDVQRIVEQKLIDESRHVKLIAEKDSSSSASTSSTSSFKRINKSSSFLKSNQNRAKSVDNSNTTTSQTKKYLNQVYGATFLASLQREAEQEKRKREIELKQQQREREQEIRNLNKNKKKVIPISSQKPIANTNKATSTLPKSNSTSSTSTSTAFLTIPFKSSLNQQPQQRSRSTSAEKKPPLKHLQKLNPNQNVGLVTIITYDQDDEENEYNNRQKNKDEGSFVPKGELKRQVRLVF